MDPTSDASHEASSRQVVFGPFCVVPAQRLLTRDGERVEIGGRALDLLIALVAHPGKVLSKRDLMKQVWPDSVVEEGALRFHMNGLRRILRDGVDGARYIATQVGVGYAFVGLDPEATPVSVSRRYDQTPHIGNLPPRPQLIGREADTRHIVDRLQEPGLFTVVGPGGVGKTSLAVEVAHQLQDRYGPAYFTDLAQIEDASLVPSALAGALGIPVQSEDPVFVLLAHLQGRRLLLLVDNCEHLLNAVPGLLERIREVAPQVCLLATSREPLRARGEQLHWLDPLAFPTGNEPLSVDELLTFPAVRLFVERASMGGGPLPLDVHDARLIADVCRRLDGMALPIELAAVRVATHGLQATHAMLGERFSLGWAGHRTALPRHQTLRATLDWSYDLLTPEEHLVFDRLAIFVGPFSQAAASEIVADARIDATTVAATLDDLASKGLVVLDRSEPLYGYRLLEMTRAYARERLALHDEAEQHAIAFRHAAFYLDLLQGQGRSTEEVFAGIARLANQLGNLRSALEWGFGPLGDPGLAIPLAAACAPLFMHFSLLVECRAWCSRATDLLELGYFGTTVELELQAALGLLLMFTRGNSGAAEKALLRARDVAVALGDHWSRLRILGRLQIFYERIGDFASSLAWAEEAVEVGETIGEPEAMAVAASLAGVSHHLLGNQVRARHELEKALRYSAPSERCHTIHYGFDHHNRTGLALARTLWLLGYPDQSRQWATQVEAEAARLDHPITHCIAMVWTLCIRIWTGDLDEATETLALFRSMAEANAFGPYVAASPGMQAAIAIRAGEPDKAIEWLEESLSRLHAMRYELLTVSFEIALAEGLMLDGQHARALPLVEGTIAHCRCSGDAYSLPELLRLKANIIKALGDPVTAEAVLHESLELAGEQGARAWRLRTSMDLARMRHEQGRTAEAVAMLRPFQERDSEGRDTLDMRELDRLWHTLV